MSAVARRHARPGQADIAAANFEAELGGRSEGAKSEARRGEAKPALNFSSSLFSWRPIVARRAILHSRAPSFFGLERLTTSRVGRAPAAPRKLHRIKPEAPKYDDDDDEDDEDVGHEDGRAREDELGRPAARAYQWTNMIMAEVRRRRPDLYARGVLASGSSRTRTLGLPLQPPSRGRGRCFRGGVFKQKLQLNSEF